LGRTAGPDEVAGFWRSVIEANRELIRSGDPDLIYPGEVVVLPPSG
jgi:nucleoid-associated protein YgaU